MATKCQLQVLYLFHRNKGEIDNQICFKTKRFYLCRTEKSAKFFWL